MSNLALKTYVVLQVMNVPVDGFNLRVVAVRLTRKAAQQIVDGMPGAFIQKHVAQK